MPEVVPQIRQALCSTAAQVRGISVEERILGEMSGPAAIAREAICSKLANEVIESARFA